MKPLLVLSISLMVFACSKKSTKQDPIVGSWEFSRAVEVINDSSFTHLEVGEVISGELNFEPNGEFSFTHYHGTPNKQEKYFYTTSGSWQNQNGIYSIEYDAVLEPNQVDTMDYKNHPKVIFKDHQMEDGKELKLQSDNKVINGVPVEYFYRIFHR